MIEPDEHPPEKESATTGRKQRLVDPSAVRFSRQARPWLIETPLARWWNRERARKDRAE
jgi:hypothetical protein